MLIACCSHSIDFDCDDSRMNEILGQIFQIGFFAALIRIATPLVFGTIGELFAERAGILNLGIEGIMMLAAMTGFSMAYFSGSLWLGVVAAVVTGMIFVWSWPF